MLADFFDGKEDEEAQKTLHARRTKISQATNSQPGHALRLNQRETGKTPQVTLADLARWQRRRSSTEDVPREEDEDLTGEESHRPIKPQAQ